MQSAGTFTFDKRLILTKDGLTRSKWLLPELFSAAEISYHINDSWKEGYFQSAGRGQEFVIKDSEKVEEWVMRLVEGSVSGYRTN